MWKNVALAARWPVAALLLALAVYALLRPWGPLGDNPGLPGPVAGSRVVEEVEVQETTPEENDAGPDAGADEGVLVPAAATLFDATPFGPTAALVVTSLAAAPVIDLIDGSTRDAADRPRTASGTVEEPPTPGTVEEPPTPGTVEEPPTRTSPTREEAGREAEQRPGKAERKTGKAERNAGKKAGKAERKAGKAERNAGKKAGKAERKAGKAERNAGKKAGKAERKAGKAERNEKKAGKAERKAGNAERTAERNDAREHVNARPSGPSHAAVAPAARPPAHAVKHTAKKHAKALAHGSKKRGHGKAHGNGKKHRSKRR